MLKGTTSATITFKQDALVDFNVPTGIGGMLSPLLTCAVSQGVNINITNVFFTYKRDDLINIWEGTGSEIGGYVEAFTTYRPHVGMTAKDMQPYLTKRPHEGVDIKESEPYISYKQEDKVDSFLIPYGIGGTAIPFITLNINTMCGYINDLDVTKLSGIAVENTHFPLAKVGAVNDVLVRNNNTTA